jgi:FkbM family methyltransferase
MARDSTLSDLPPVAMSRLTAIIWAPMIDRLSQHAFLSGPLHAQSIVWDLGANQGEFCLEVARKYGCRVMACEPVPELAEALEGCSSSITVLRNAAGGEDTTVSFDYDLTKNKTGSMMGLAVVGGLLNEAATLKRVSVQVLSLASLFAKAGVDRVNLLKLDIEGAELDLLLKSPAEVLQRCDQITVEFHDYWYPELSERTEQAKARLQSLGFYMIRFTPNNKDVLFINSRRLPLSGWQKFWVGTVLRNFYGFGRMLRVYSRRLVGG